MGSSVPLLRDHGGGEEHGVAMGSESRAGGELLLVASLLLPEAALFAALVGGALEMAQYLLLHIGGCATVVALGLCRIWWIGAAESAGSRTAVLLHGMVWILLAGPFGALIVAALLVPRSASAGQDGSLADQVAAEPVELSRVEAMHSGLLDRRFRLQQGAHIRSMLDVMIDGTQVEKLDALRLIANRYVPGLAPATWRALEDKDAAVRVFAATVMAHQHNMHTKRIGALQTATANEPGCTDKWRELAQAHEDYAACGLLDTSRADEEAREARVCMARATQAATAADEL
jgi:hypothetical protein